MKKWHMEGILLSGGRSGNKLELPEKSWKIHWEPVKPGSDKAKRDPVLSRYVKTAAHKFITILR